MTVSVTAAYRLASEIEWVNAQDRAARTARVRNGPSRRQIAEDEYDPLAATCLAELILTRLNGPDV